MAQLQKLAPCLWFDDEAEEAARHYVSIFDDGRIQQLATPDVLYEAPENSFVAQFIGENNKLNGTVKSFRQDGLCEVQIDGGPVVEALGVNVSDVGQKTTLSLRPERVEINPDEGSTPNRVEGRIEELIYLGGSGRHGPRGRPDDVGRPADVAAGGGLPPGSRLDRRAGGDRNGRLGQPGLPRSRSHAGLSR